jgi:hypothetical protein
MNHAIVSREQWLDARKALLAKERAMTMRSAPSAGSCPGSGSRSPMSSKGPRVNARSATCSAAAASSPSIISC